MILIAQYCVRSDFNTDEIKLGNISWDCKLNGYEVKVGVEKISSNTTETRSLICVNCEILPTVFLHSGRFKYKENR